MRITRPSRGTSTITGIIIALSAHAQVAFEPIAVDNPDPQPNAGFGHAMAGVGDVDVDGVADYLVGARFQDVDGQVDQGRAYLFSGADNSLLRTLENPMPQAGASFARWVSGVGDVDGDEVPDLFVGTPFQSIDGNFQQGWAHVFSGATGEVIYELNDPSGQPKGHFGLVVSGAGDLNGDGTQDLFVGAHFKDIGGNIDQGQAFVFDGATGELSMTLTTPEPIAGAFYGFPVAGVGDANGDTFPDLLVGAATYSVGGNDGQGRAFIHSGVDGKLLHILDTPNPQRNGGFGRSVSGAGDLNRDGIPDVIVGAHLHDVGGTRAQGQAFVYSGATGQLLMTLDDPTPQQRAWFGFPVSSIDDVSGDGVTDILVGAPLHRAQGNSTQGKAYVFSGSTGRLLRMLQNPNPQPGAQFGFRIVPLGGDMNNDGIPDILVGAFKQDVHPPPEHLGFARYPAHAMPHQQCPFDGLPHDVWSRTPVLGNEDQGQAFVFASVKAR